MPMTRGSGRRPQDRQRHLAIPPEPCRRKAVHQVRHPDRPPSRGPSAELVFGSDARPSCPTCSASGPALPNGWGITSRSRRRRRHSSSRSASEPVKPQHLLLGDPIDADAKGQPTDIPLALHYIELMSRKRALPGASGTRVLGRLLKDCDEIGVWRPKIFGRSPRRSTRSPITTTRCRSRPRPPRVAKWMSPSGWR